MDKVSERKRLNIDIDGELLRDAKRKALDEGISLRELVTRLLAKAVGK